MRRGHEYLNTLITREFISIPLVLRSQYFNIFLSMCNLKFTLDIILFIIDVLDRQLLMYIPNALTLDTYVYCID